MWCSLFIRFLNLPEGNYLPGWSLCIHFPNLPPRDCWKGVQPDCTCSVPTSWGQSARAHPVLQFSNRFSMGLLAGGCKLFVMLRTYFQGTATVECRRFIRFLNLSLGDCLPGWSLFIWYANLPPGEPTSRELSAQVESFCMVSKPTSRGLECSLFYLFQTYIQGPFCWGFILFLRFQNLPLGDCRLGV